MVKEKVKIKCGFLTVAVIIIIICVLAVGGIYLLSQRKSVLTQPIKTPSQPFDTGRNDTTSWKIYEDEVMDIKFKHPKEWKVVDSGIAEEGVYGLSVNLGKGKSIFIIQYDNHENIRPAEWFWQNRDKFTSTAKGLGNLTIQNHQAYVIGLPRQCGMPAVIIVFIENKDKMLKIISDTDGEYAAELKQLLENFSFGSETSFKDIQLAKNLFVYPVSLNEKCK